MQLAHSIATTAAIRANLQLPGVIAFDRLIASLILVLSIIGPVKNFISTAHVSKKFALLQTPMPKTHAGM